MPHFFGHLISQLGRAGGMFRNGGFGGTWRRVIQRFSGEARAYRRRKTAEDAAYDADGYDTGGIQPLHSLETIGGNVPSGCDHVAVPPADFAVALAHLDLDIDGLTFIDLGSGKGRALLMAAERPFARIIGVEFAREMHEIAEANVQCRAELRGADARIELLNIDATTYAFPDAPLLLFLFNPFEPPVLTKVIENALLSWQAHRRPMRVLYMNPRFSEEWTRAGWQKLAGGGGTNLYGPPDS